MRFSFPLRLSVVAFFFTVLGCLLMLHSSESTAAPYFQGKTITIVRGGMPGGTGERQARTTVPFLRKYIPGNPSIVMLHMPGAAGRKAANYVYKTRRKDTVIAALGGGLVIGPILGLPGVNYDINKMIYLGSTESGSPYLFYTRKELGLDSLDKFRAAKGIRVGAQAVGHPIFYSSRIVLYLLGMTDAKFVTGYSGRELDLALLRGEVDGRMNNAQTLMRRNADWVERGMIDVQMMITVPKGKAHPRFKDAPSIDSFAKSRMDRKVLEMFRSILYPRWPFFMAPGAPEESVRILKEAFRKTLNDPEYRKYFKKMMRAKASPLDGDETQKAIDAIPRDPEVLKVFKALAGPGPLPKR